MNKKCSTEYKAATTWINRAESAEAKSWPNLLRDREQWSVLID